MTPFRALIPEFEAILKDNTGDNIPSTTATVAASMFSGPAYTKAIENNPEIKV
jgi:hypothetical protein